MGRQARRQRALVVQPRPQQARITLNLKHPKAAGIVLRLVEGVPWSRTSAPGNNSSASAEVLRRARPGLVVAHISGFGQDGPTATGRRSASSARRSAACDLTNHPPGTTDLPPARVGISIGDLLAGLYAAFGIMAALWQRDRAGGDGRGRT